MSLLFVTLKSDKDKFIMAADLACFATKIRKLLMKVAVEQRVNVAASRHVTGTWLVVRVSLNIQA
jgi:hypothetical protein